MAVVPQKRRDWKMAKVVLSQEDKHLNTLYKLDEQLATILELPDSADGGVDVETGEIFSKERLDSLKMAREAKIEGCLLFIKNKNALINNLKEEEARLKARRKALENRVDWLKEYVSDSLQYKEFETSKVRATFRKSESIECVSDMSIDKVPLIFRKQEVKESIMRDAIKAFIKEGNKVAGWFIKTNWNLQIK